MQEVQKEYRERGIGHKKRGDLKGGWTGERLFFMRRQGKEECEMSFASANLHKLLSPLLFPSSLSPFSILSFPLSPLSPTTFKIPLSAPYSASERQGNVTKFISKVLCLSPSSWTDHMCLKFYSPLLSVPKSYSIFCLW